MYRPSRAVSTRCEQRGQSRTLPDGPRREATAASSVQRRVHLGGLYVPRSDTDHGYLPSGLLTATEPVVAFR
ncbi:hypothetical protein DPMN_043605 [Dreissena polymorpha]|uniref:Uncharacterized protein n=1 Tax=Dreissena polymorpha TaxID=45954 RepID=A0A9D4D339_DREPO|nr:hypothetical protein DPMN_043605 [Dreissena polymorpha]